MPKKGNELTNAIRAKARGVPKKISPHQWQRWVAAFRRHPLRAEVLKECPDLSAPRASAAWTRGFPAQGLPSIRSIVGAEMERAREIRHEAELEQAQRQEQRVEVEVMVRERKRLKQLEAAAQTRAEEAMLVSTARRNAIALAGVTAQVLQGALQLGQKIGQELSRQAAEKTVDVELSLKLLQRAANITRLNNDAAKMAFQMERMVLGIPPEGDESSDGQMTLEDSERWFAEAHEAFQRARARRLLGPGGGGEDQDQVDGGPGDPAGGSVH